MASNTGSVPAAPGFCLVAFGNVGRISLGSRLKSLCAKITVSTYTRQAIQTEEEEEDGNRQFG